MSLKDSALAVLTRNQERNRGATSDKKTVQLKPHLRGGKVASNKLLVAVSIACKGLEITPDQFIWLTTKEDHELISSGNFSTDVLRAYAKNFADGIKERRIVFHPTFYQGIPGTKHETYSLKNSN